jgi:chromosome partitioning protein
MARMMVFANRKGGCGKTTTAVTVAHGLALNGRKVLLVDMDPQAHASISLRVSPEIPRSNVIHLLNRDATVKDVWIPTHIPDLSLIPASRELTAFEIKMRRDAGSEMRLAEILQPVLSEFDVVIFDPPPTVGLLMVSSLVAAREVFIPLQMHFLAMEGLAEMMRLIYLVNATWNPQLHLTAIIPTFFNRQTRLAREICADIKKNFGENKITTGIRMNISIAEAPGHGKTVLEYAPGSSGAADYRKLTAWITENATG